jgi:RHS repeat-associated protein
MAMIDHTNRVYYYVKDHLGSTLVLVRDDGITSAKYYRYTAYGDCKKETMNIAQPNKFTGKPLDGELGLNLYYFGARYYMPNLGRWTSVDPMLAKYPGWSPYSYTRCNPLTLIDPDGMADQLAPQSAEQNNEKFRERNGAPPNKIAVVKEMEKKVREIVRRLAEVTIETTEEGLDAVENVCSEAGPAVALTGTLLGQPQVTTAGVAISTVGVVASSIKAVVNPTAENRSNAIISLATYGASRYGGRFLRQQVSAQRLTPAEATALSVEVAIGAKVAKEAATTLVEKEFKQNMSEPRQ